MTKMKEMTVTKRRYFTIVVLCYITGIATGINWIICSESFLNLNPPTYENEQYAEMRQELDKIDISDISKVNSIVQKYGATYNPETTLVYFPENVKKQKLRLIDAPLFYKLSFGLFGHKTYYSQSGFYLDINKIDNE